MKESNIKRCSKPWNVHIDSEGSFVDVKDLFIYFKSEELHTHIYEDGLQSLTLLSKLKNEVLHSKQHTEHLHTARYS